MWQWATEVDIGRLDPIQSPPDFLPEKQWKTFAEDWQTTVEDFVLPAGEIAVLLAALDRQVKGAGDTSPTEAGGVQRQITIGHHTHIFPCAMWPTYFDGHCVAMLLIDQQTRPPIADFLSS